MAALIWSKEWHGGFDGLPRLLLTQNGVVATLSAMVKPSDVACTEKCRHEAISCAMRSELVQWRREDEEERLTCGPGLSASEETMRS